MTQLFTPGAHHRTPEPVEPVLGILKRWSYSSLTKYEQCPYRAFLSNGKRIKEPSGPAAERGTGIHDQLEKFVKGEVDELPKEITKRGREKIYEDLRDRYIDGSAFPEAEWSYSMEWEPVPWDEAWNVFKIDMVVRDSPTSLKIRDYKTGKRFGNEMKHIEQCLMYAVAGFWQYPEVEHIQTDVDYIDEGVITLVKNYSRDQAMLFHPRIHKRGIAMTTATEFPPKPSSHNCKWCRYKEMVDEETGELLCKWGVTA
jgi:hypothetical protein